MDYSYRYLSLPMKRTDTLTLPMPSVVQMDVNGQFSFDIWCLVSDLNTKKILLSQRNALEFGIEDDSLYVLLADGRKLATESVLLPDIWNNIAVSAYEGNVRIFLNGEVQAETQWEKAERVHDSDEQQVTLGDQFFGKIRRLRFYSVALITDEIRQNMYSEILSETMAADYDFSCMPPVEHRTNHEVALSEKMKIVRTMPAAAFEEYSFLRCVDPDVNPGRFRDLSYTIQAWICLAPDEVRDYFVIFSNEDLLHDTGMEWGVCREEDGFHLRLLHGALTEKATVKTSDTVEVNTWINVALVYEKDRVRIYKDGILMENTESVPHFHEEWTKPRVLIGAGASGKGDGGSAWFSGQISRVDVWKKTCTEEEIKRFAIASPVDFPEGLAASWELWQPNMFNRISGVPLGRINELHIKEQERNAVLGERESQLHIRRMRSPLPEEELRKARAQASMDNLSAKYTEACERSVLSSYRYEEYIYFIYHTSEESQVLTRINADADEYAVWCTELILIMVESIGSWFLSVKFTYNDQLVEFIRRTILQAGATRALFIKIGEVGTITVEGVFTAVYEWLRKGYLRDVLHLLIPDLSYWTLLSVVIGLVRRFGGGVAGLLVWLSGLVLRLTIHIKNYPKEKMPVIRLDTILFCHEEPGKICAIRTRKNKNETWTLPEWKSTRSEGNQVPAVYRLKRFDDTEDCLELQASIEFGSIKGQTIVLRADGGKVFGMSDEVSVSSDTDGVYTETLFFRFPKHTLQKGGISAYDLTISWEYKKTGVNDMGAGVGEFLRFCLSKNRIYTIFDSVRPPWGRNEGVARALGGVHFLTRYPETDLYERTIGIISGEMFPDNAKGKLTQFLYDSRKLKYNGGSALVMEKTEGQERRVGILSHYEDYLSFGAGETIMANCADCTCVLIMMTNLYGCDLHMLKLGNNYKVNPLWLIGEDASRLPVGASGSGFFDFHVLALDGADISNPTNMHVYDACFRFKDAGESTNPWILAKGLPLSGYPTDPEIKNPPIKGTYRESVCDNSDEGVMRCESQWVCEVYFSEM